MCSPRKKSDLQMSDKVVVVEDGRITAIGKPNEVWSLIEEDIECLKRMECQGDMSYEIQ